MAESTPAGIGDLLAQQLLRAVFEAQHAPLPGARDLPILEGLHRGGGFSAPQENVLLNAITILASSNRLFLYGNAIMLSVTNFSGGQTLVPLRTGFGVEPGADSWLANLIICHESRGDFIVPRWFVEALLRCESLLYQLPRIRTYARRATFDENFVLRGPGWHADAGILVHGTAIEPVPFAPTPSGVPALDRLPLHLRTLLHHFCFREDADVANTIGAMLTGLLVIIFIASGKPIILVDGNKPGLGKTLLLRVIAMVLDGVEPPLLFYTADDEEMQKRICAKLREGCGSLLLIDNAKTHSNNPVSSAVIESQSVAPEASFRILGQSTNFTRPNDFLWALTMNNTRTSPDLVSRGLPIRLHYDEPVEDRDFHGTDPLDYARQHRLEILGELAGLVVYWNQQGRPQGSRGHRLATWAQVIGGIMEVAGFPEFLANAQSAAASFNAEMDELAAVLEAVVAGSGPVIIIETNNSTGGLT